MLPKIIHQIIGPTATDFILDCVCSWRELEEEGFVMKIWTNQEVETFLRNEFPFAIKAYLTARNPAEAADIARYLIVHKFGGYYMDWDIRLLDKIEFLKLHERYPNGYLLRDPSNGTLASEHFSAAPNERFLFKLTRDIVDTFERNERELMPTPQYSGPYRMRSSIQRHPITDQVLLPVKDVFEYDYSEIRTSDPDAITSKAMIHYWKHSWIK